MSLANPPYTQREIELANTIINVVTSLYFGQTYARPATQSVATIIASYRHELSIATPAKEIKTQEAA